VTPNCTGLGLGDCLGQAFGSAMGMAIATFLIIGAVFTSIVIIIWFLTGMFVGWLVVRHVRRLEPGITRRQGWMVSAGWGCGAIVAAMIAMLVIGILASTFRL